MSQTDYTPQQLAWAAELHRCRADFAYAANHYLSIKTKQTIGLSPLRFNRVQARLWAAMADQLRRTGQIRQIWGKSRQVGSCLDPDTPVLTADLRWVPLGKIVVGDRLIAVDEVPPVIARGHGRKFRTAIVEAVNDVYEPSFLLRLRNGRTLIATGEHRFLTRKGFLCRHSGSRWQAVRDFAPGQRRIRDAIRPWEDTHDFEDGWMGGILDGEGCFRYKRSGVELNVTQADGPVWNRILRYLQSRDYTAHLHVDDRQPGPRSKLGTKKLNRAHVFHLNEVMRLLAQTRPARWSGVADWWDGKALSGCGYDDAQSWAIVDEIIPLGHRRMIDIQTSTGTFIANGFVSHNSTLSRAFSFWNCAFRPNRNAILIAHDEPSSYELFTIDKLMYEQLPKALKPKTSFDSKFKLEFPALNSKIVVGHARNMNVGASQMSHIAHLTEVARYPNPDEVQASLFPAFSDARGQQDYSAIILESTSHFNGAWFKEFAEQAQRGENGFEFHFVPWFEHEDYTLPVPDTFAHTLTMDERDLMRRYKLTLGQIAWRRQKRATYVNPVLFEQEYPLDWESSWRLPMGTHRVFGDLELAWIEDTIAPGVRHMPTARGLEETFGGMLEVWQPPREGVFYHLGVDVAQGRDTQADWTVLSVLRGDTCEQVAEARFKWDPADREFHDFVYWTGLAYNTASIIPDITGGWGHALLSELQRRSYANLWQWRRRDDLTEKVSKRVGFVYTKRDKMALINNGVTLVRQRKAAVRSLTLLNEMRTFIQVMDEYMAAPGTKDDAVNAWLLAALSAVDATIGLMDIPEEPIVVRPDGRPWATHDIDADLHGTGQQPGWLRSW